MAKSAGWASEILKIPSILKILILTKALGLPPHPHMRPETAGGGLKLARFGGIV